MDETLADVIHDAQCSDKIRSKAGRSYCRRYDRGAGDPHYDFYQGQAAALAARLEPVIGGANVLPVVRLVVGELC
jgi:hypothetical protein